MKHAWGCLLVVAACGPSGEPMKGSIAFTYGTSMPKMAFGAAVASKDTPGQMVVQMGDDNLDCGTDLADSGITFNPPSGTFVYFLVDATTPGSDASAEISVQRSSSNSLSINEAGGTVTIDTVMPRVTGSLTFTTTDMDVGEISVSGNFDIKRCF
jgi:hypothetical protein